MEKENMRGIGMGWPESKDRPDRTLEQQITDRQQNWQSYDDLLEEQQAKGQREESSDRPEWSNGFVIGKEGKTIWSRE